MISINLIESVFIWKSIKEIKDRYRIEKKGGWNARCGRFEPMHGSFFRKNPAECDENKNFTAKIRISYKNSP